MAEIKTYVGNKSGIEVRAMLIESHDDVADLRAAEEWHEGAIALLTFPTAPPIAYVSLDNPKYFGRAVDLGQAVVQGPAGDWGVVPTPGFLENYTEVGS